MLIRMAIFEYRKNKKSNGFVTLLNGNKHKRFPAWALSRQRIGKDMMLFPIFSLTVENYFKRHVFIAIQEEKKINLTACFESRKLCFTYFFKEKYVKTHSVYQEKYLLLISFYSKTRE